MPILPLLELVEEQCDRYERDLALMQANVLFTVERRNGCLVNTTPARVDRMTASLDDLRALLREHGRTPQLPDRKAPIPMVAACPRSHGGGLTRLLRHHIGR
jgi:hypothetical protein